MNVPLQSRLPPRWSSRLKAGAFVLSLSTVIVSCSPVQNSLSDAVPCSALTEVRDRALLDLPPTLADDIAKNNRAYARWCLSTSS